MNCEVLSEENNDSIIRFLDYNNKRIQIDRSKKDKLVNFFKQHKTLTCDDPMENLKIADDFNGIITDFLNEKYENSKENLDRKKKEEDSLSGKDSVDNIVLDVLELAGQAFKKVMVTIKKNQVISDVLFEGLESVMEDVFDSKDSLWVNAIQCITDILRELI